MTLNQWDKYHCYGLVSLSFVYSLTQSFLPIVGFSILSFTALWISHWKEIKNLRPPGGLANRVTLIRLAGLTTLMLLAFRISNQVLSLLLFVLVLMDGLDGYLARKKDQRTTFGANFDMETDALFVCLVSVLLISKGLSAKWILIPAWIKYYYTVFIDLAGLNTVPEKRTLFGATAAFIMFLALVLAFVLPEKTRLILTISATILLTISFASSLVKAVVLKNRPRGDVKETK
ncbi:MAG: CDP-alcohol phosphatidyltransferase family protein [Deltaproteobacteria bacterium]|nr:CDP-alcohol phosphatidyltransferase family protein [Deltaproteobacteria bacterium]